MNAKKLSAMLEDKPESRPFSPLAYSLKLAVSDKTYFTLKAAQQLSFWEFYNLDLLFLPLLLVTILKC